MNYYPYFMSIPYTSNIPTKTGLFTNLFKGINFSSILNGTSKVLNVANQAIPLIKQAKPVINNAKTMFHVMNEFKKIDNVNNSTIAKYTNNIINDSTNLITSNNNSNITKNDSLPTFFQ